MEESKIVVQVINSRYVRNCAELTPEFRWPSDPDPPYNRSKNYNEYPFKEKAKEKDPYQSWFRTYHWSFTPHFGVVILDKNGLYIL